MPDPVAAIYRCSISLKKNRIKFKFSFTNPILYPICYGNPAHFVLAPSRIYPYYLKSLRTHLPSPDPHRGSLVIHEAER
jgi:hypothetical protein